MKKPDCPIPRKFLALSSCFCRALPLLVACLASCGKAPDSGTASSSGTATVEVKPINLKKIPLAEGAEVLAQNPVMVSYKAKKDIESLYHFHQKQFLEQGWKEGADSSVTAASATATFTGAGYKILLSAYPLGDGTINVTLQNHGNVDLSKLPLPPGTTPLYVGPLSAIHVTQAAAGATLEATRKLLSDSGWEAHGATADSLYFKKGLNRITATISVAPAQGGKTMISYSSQMLSADLPAPPDAQELRYLDSKQELLFEGSPDKDQIASFYKARLAASAWKPNDEKLLHIDDYDLMVFRTPAGDVLFLKIQAERAGKRSVSLTYFSAEQAAELDKKSAAAKGDAGK